MDVEGLEGVVTGYPNPDYLEPLSDKKRGKRRKFVAVDLESKDDDTQRAGFTRPFLVGMYDPDVDEYQEFRDEPHLRTRPWQERHILPGGCVDKLLSVVLTKKYKNRIFYAHNGGNFDWLFLLSWLERHRDEFVFEVIPVQSSIQLLRVWPKGQPDLSGSALVDDKPPRKRRKRERVVWEFLDSYKLLSMGLDSACKSFGIEGKKDHDLHLHEEDPSWSEYLRQDCVALARVMQRFYDLVDKLGGEVGITAPSTAMKLFRRRFLGKDGTPSRVPRWRHWDDCTTPDTCGSCAQTWIRRGYYGGRTEIFRLFGENVKYYDINSSYVAAMRYKMPVGDRYVEDGRLDWHKHASKGGRYVGFCECTVYVPPDCPIPPLPHRDRSTGKLIFPAGRFHGVWDVDELALLSDPIVNGKIELVTRTVWFREGPLFEEMVDTLWRFRMPQCDVCRPDMEARGYKRPCEHYDGGLSALAKLLGNSAYGKFCMKQERTSIVFEKDIEKRQGRCFLCGEKTPLLGPNEEHAAFCLECEGSKPATGEPDTTVWYQKKRVDAPYIIPQIGAHITALARVRLWGYMKEAITTRAGLELPGSLRPGSVVFIGSEVERPSVVEEVSPSSRGTRLQVRYDDGKGRVVRSIVDVSEQIHVGGWIMYTDTDSVITDVAIRTGIRLGEMKDEYPGETLTFTAVQPKVYAIERTSYNVDVAARRAIFDAAMSGDERFDASTLDRDPMRFLSPKVTAKGFPIDLRTMENLDRLKAGETLDMLPSGEPWRRLEKVRALAREGFRRGPKMNPVKKSFRSAYDKRIVCKDGISTRSIVLDEPVGGFGTDLAAE